MLDRARTSPWLLPLLLTAVAAVVLFVRLDEPARIVFDETYYVGDARSYLAIGVEDSFAVHPPVGKWIIAVGMWLFGDGPFGWRFSSALIGAATVFVTYLVGLRLLRDRAFAALAALLLLTDGLFLVQARTAMLDIFLACFVTVAAWALLVDRDQRRLGARFDPPPPADPVAPPTPDADTAALDVADLDTLNLDAPDPDSPDPDKPDADLDAATDAPDPDAAEAIPAPDAAADVPASDGRFRWVAGIALGLAIGTKWSGLLALGAAGLVVLGWELAVRHRRDGSIVRRWPALVGSVATTLVLVPAAVYVLSWVPWLVQYEQASPSDACAAPTDQPVTLADRVEGLWCYHGAIWRFHRGLDADHPYRAPAYTWPVLARPVVYYWETCKGDRAAGVATENDDGELVEPEPCVVAEGQAGEIIAMGNPITWWLFLGAVIPLLAGAVARDPRAWFLVAFWAAQFVPWLVPPMGARPVFIFYMTPVVPFLALTLAYVCRTISERRDLVTPAFGGLLAGAVALGAGFVLDAGTPGRWLWAGVGYVLGAIVGSLAAYRRGELDPQPVGLGWDAGRVVAVAVGMAAVLAFVYFYPVWTALPLAEDAVRHRWWIQPGWI